MIDNPDRALVARAIEQALVDEPVRANPMAIAMRMVLRRAERGRVRVAYDIGEQFCQGGGVVQGGIVASMLDFGMAFAALSTVGEGESVASVGLNVNFLRAAPAGRYEVDASLEKAGRRMVFARATLMRPDGEPVASASSPITVLRG